MDGCRAGRVAHLCVSCKGGDREGWRSRSFPCAFLRCIRAGSHSTDEPSRRGWRSRRGARFEKEECVHLSHLCKKRKGGPPAKPTFTTSYEYEINPDLSNTGSTFYSDQCGNYNAQTNPNGYISGSNLLTQTNRHEWNSTTESHYAFYSNSISGTNNFGNYVEARIATPGTSPQTFDSTTSSDLATLNQNILTAFKVEPYAVNEDANGNFLGSINYAPYSPCN